MNDVKKTVLPRQVLNKKRLLLPLVILAAIVWALVKLPAFTLKQNAALVAGGMLDGLRRPDWAYVWTGDGEDLINTMLMTLAIAFLGTLISAILSVPLAYLAAQRRGPRHLLKRQLLPASWRLVLTAVRTFPELVLALMFIKAVGPGPFAGVLAVGVHSVGMLAKLFAEAISEQPKGPLEAITAAGGSRLGVFRLASLPQLLPAFISATLYRFELAVRSASILGMVGAGGIGTPLIFAIAVRNWHRVSVILLGIVLTVSAVDWLSGKLRQILA